jgi:hypothetical protein
MHSFLAPPAKYNLCGVSDTARSANSGLMGSFETDGTKSEVVRSFALKNKDLVSTVGIIFDSTYSKRSSTPPEIRLAITVSDKEQENMFESVDSSEAKTRYGKKWNLSVTRNINFDNVTYKFSFRCWDTSGFAGKKPF